MLGQALSITLPLVDETNFLTHFYYQSLSSEEAGRDNPRWLGIVQDFFSVPEDSTLQEQLLKDKTLASRDHQSTRRRQALLMMRGAERSPFSGRDWEEMSLRSQRLEGGIYIPQLLDLLVNGFFQWRRRGGRKPRTVFIRSYSGRTFCGICSSK